MFISELFCFVLFLSIVSFCNTLEGGGVGGICMCVGGRGGANMQYA